MGQTLPKQYLALAGRPMLFHSLRRFCSASAIARVFVILAPDDTRWPHYDWSEFEGRMRVLYCGGETRAETVGNALAALAGEIEEKDWLLVHDAARPCLSSELLTTLLQAVGRDKVGGLLALPLADTLKRADREKRVGSTESREGLWLAQTPQMFRYALLRRALEAMPAGIATDESRAVEHLGLYPLLVQSDHGNLKVTFPADLALAELILRARGA